MWIPMIFIAVINGMARDLWYKNILGEFVGRQLSTLTLIILFAIYMWVGFRMFTPESSTQAIKIGLAWFVLTLIFEFGLGLSTGHSWSELISDYDITKGKIWVLIPIWVGIAPSVFYNFLK